MNGKLLLKHMAKWKLLYVVTIMASLSFVGVNAFDSYSPAVVSDKEDYKPGETAIITGSGWGRDSKVYIVVEEDPEYDHQNRYEITVKDDGTWVLGFPIDERHLGVKFHLTATGNNTGYVAETKFTDGNFSFGATGLPTSTEVTVNYSVSGNTNNGGGTFNAIFTPPSTANLGVNSRTVTVNSYSPNSIIVSGIKYAVLNYSINNILGKDNSFESGGGSVSTLFVANYGALTLDAASGIYGENVNLAARLYSNYQSVAGLVNKPIVFSINGTIVGSSTTNSNGIAILNGVSLNGLSVGTHSIKATFEGDNIHFPIDVINTLEISKASATLTLNNLSSTYDGLAKPANVTTNPADLSGVTITYNGSTTAPTSAGTYVVVATLDNPNYEAESVTGEMIVSKAPATVTLANLEHTYDGTVKFASATTNAIGASSFSFTYDGSSDQPINHKEGGYTVIATLVNDNYFGSATGTLLIDKADQSIAWSTPANIEYGTLLSTDQLNASLTTGDGALTYNPALGTLLDAGTYQLGVSAAETNNYKAATASVSIEVTKATPSIVLVIGGPYTYNGSPVAVSGATVSGIGGTSLGAATVSYEKDGVSVLSPVNAGTYDVTASFAGNTNYNAAVTTGILEIEKAQATLTLSNMSGHTYDGTPKFAVVTTEPAGLSGVNITNNGQINPERYNIVASLDNPNYVAESIGGQLIINKATLTIKADNASRIYGDQNPAFTGSVVSGAVQGETFDVTATSDALSGSNVGEYDITPSVSGATVDFYNVIATNGTLTIFERPITVTADAGQGKVYGESNPTAYTYQISAGNLVDDSHLTGALTRALGENVGSYAITQGTLVATANYALTYTGADFSISKRDVTVTADAKSKTYGDEDPEFTYEVTSGSVVNGDAFSGVLQRAVGENVGDYAINLGTLTLGNNYNLGFAGSAVLGITPKAITVTPNAGQNKVYGSADPVLAYTNTTLVGSDAFTGSLSREPGSSVGDYNVTQGTLALSNNYSLDFVEGVKFNITPKSLTASISATDKVYDGTTTASATGSVPVSELVTGDVVEVTVNNATFDSKNVGSGKTVTATVSISNPNYSLSNYVASTTASITAKEITGAFAAADKVYDGTAVASVTDRSLAGVISEDVVQLTGGTATFSDKNVATGKTVTLAGATLSGTDKDNYSLTEVTTASADISAKAASVSPIANSKVYGAEEPVLSGTTDGFLEVDGITATYARTLGEQVANYTISATLSPENALGNYAITYNTAAFEITKAKLVATADNKSKVYGDQNPDFTGGLEGVVNNDVIVATFNSVATVASPVQTYAITPSLTGDALSNYEIELNDGMLTITPAALSVKADDANKVYGDENPAFDGAISGIKNNDAITATYSTPATASSIVGEYAIVPTLAGAALSNYTVTETNGKLTITKAAITVVANNKSRIFGVANPTLDGVLTGVKNSDGITAVYSTTADENSNVGPYAITVLLSDPNDRIGNYTVSNTPATLTITQAPATITVAGLDKVYNRTAQAATVTTSPADLSVTVTYNGSSDVPTAAGSYAVEAVLNNSNYSAQNATGTLVISQKEVTATLANAGKVYDGTTTATGTTASLSGVISPDAVTTSVTNAEFSNAAAGPRTVTATVELAGADKANYTLTAVTPANATISRKELIATIVAQNKVYDGNSDASAEGSVSGVIAGDEVTVTISNAKFADKNAEDNKSVTADVAISNPNYVLTSSQAATTASIMKAPLTITAPSMNKYCGTVNPTTYNCSVVGAVNGEVIATSYSFSGTNVIPSSSDPKLSNYEVVYNNGTLTVNAVSLEQNNSNNPRSINEDVIITVTVKDGAATQAGVSVKLMIDGVERSTATSNQTGVATFNIGRLAANVYAVKIVAGDGCSESSLAYMPVYDPDGGFVTGGGWINSPVQPGVQFMHTAGKANFGFNAKYKKGKNEVNEVDGNTTFHLNAGNMDFKSSSHTAMSLVIAKHKATYTGEGTINGMGGYAFRVIAVDGDIKGSGNPDLFRIKIWVKSSGVVVYDNELGVGENDDPSGDNTILGGGSIVIHENKALNASSGKKLEAADQLEGLSSARFDNYPNAFSDRTTIRFAFDAAQAYTLEVYDIRGALVKRVATGNAEAGQVYEYELDARNLAEGVYFARLGAGSKVQTIKMLLKK